MALKKTLVVTLVTLLIIASTACGDRGSRQGGGTQEGPLRVVATYSVLGDLVANVGGEGVGLTTFVGPNGDAHNFEPTPSDSAELAEADLIFENGLEFETWLDNLYESSGSEAQRVVVTENIEPLEFSGEEHDHGPSTEEEHDHEHGAGAAETKLVASREELVQEDHGHEHGDDHGHEHGEYDPHVWFDVQNTIVMVESIRDALSGADPDNAETYQRNTEEYVSELEELDAWVADRTQEVPEENRKLVTSHDTFGYFAEAYGYEVVGTGLESFSTEASDPSAGETAKLVEEIKASGVPAIFAENVSNPALMERVAKEAGVELAPPLYTDALGEPEGEAGTYLEMMRYNTATITEALGG